MAAIPATPIFMRDVLLTLKASAEPTPLAFQCHVSEARVQVTPGETVTVKTLCANGSFSSAGTPEYTLVLVGIQDYDTTAASQGLSAYLWQHEGETLDVELNVYGEDAVASASTPSMKGQVTAIPGDYGGEIGAYAELNVELPFLAKPALTLTVVMEEPTEEAA